MQAQYSANSTKQKYGPVCACGTMLGLWAQTGHCVCKYMQLEHEHVEAVERYWLFCFVVALSSATDVRPQCSAALREPVPM